MSLSTLKKAFGLAVGLALGAAVAVSPAAARADALENILKQGVLKAAVPQDFPPFGSVGVDMKPMGYDVDAAALIAKDLGVKLELVPVSSGNRIPYLTTGKADIIVSTLGKNAEREKVIDFSVAYAPFFNGVFGPANVEISTPADLDGKTVGVTRGAVEDLELSKIVSDKTTINRYEDNNGTISAFLSGQVEVVATGNVVAAAILAKNPPRRPEMKFLIKNSPCYIGVNKGETALLERVNAAVAKARADGSLNAISEKWLKTPLPADL